jgi:acetyl-CoA carboxylase carboxyltransferase component
VTLEEMGGAKMHCTVSGSGDMLVKTEEEAIEATRRYIQYFPPSSDDEPRPIHPEAPLKDPHTTESIIPTNENVPFDMYELIDRLVDRHSFWEIKRLFAPEIIVGLARLDGKPIGVVANQPKVKGGVLFVDSAIKATKFIQLCDAFNIPLLFLADVPGFMIGTAVERAGIIRAGAKMIFAVSEATVPKISVVVRKAYGAGLYAMAGPGFRPDVCIALPTAMIAVMGPEAAVNAVFYNKIMELEPKDRPAYIQQLRKEYKDDIDVFRIASELIVDDMCHPNQLRTELIDRFEAYKSKDLELPRRRHGVMPQ